MKLTKLLIALLISASCYSQNPLSLWNSSWDNPIFENCNTAKNAKYMTQREKDVIWVLNCMRKSPGLFKETVIQDWDQPKRYGTIKLKNEYKNLFYYMDNIKPLDMNMIYPDSLLYISSFTHSTEFKNQKGHERITQVDINNSQSCSEVISYNSFEAIDIVMDLLVDSGNPSYGHRKCITSPKYKLAGVSINKHNLGFYSCVIDLK